MKLYLVRHGEKEGWDRDSPLAEIGVEQVKRLGKELKNKRIDKIYCSTWLRAKQTMDILKSDLGKISTEYTEKIREHDHGDVRTREELEKKMVETGLTEYEFKPSNGESFFDLEKRAQNFLNYLKRSHPKEDILLISHGRFLGLLILRALNLSINELKFFNLHEASLSTLSFDDSLKLKEFHIDENSHLVKYSSYERGVLKKI